MIVETQSGSVKEISNAYISKWEDYYWNHLGYTIEGDGDAIAYYATRKDADKEFAKFKKWLSKGAKGMFKFKGTTDWKKASERLKA